MRTLSFIVDKQIIKKDPDCDFDNLVPGTTGYLEAKFTFSEEWDDTAKIVGFWRNGHECPPQILKDGRSCVIPSEALTSRQFKIQVLGKNQKITLTTNKIEVVQNGGK